MNLINYSQKLFLNIFDNLVKFIFSNILPNMLVKHSIPIYTNWMLYQKRMENYIIFIELNHDRYHTLTKKMGKWEKRKIVGNVGDIQEISTSGAIPQLFWAIHQLSINSTICGNIKVSASFLKGRQHHLKPGSRWKNIKVSLMLISNIFK